MTRPAFTQIERELCARISAEFRRHHLDESAQAWKDLGARIERAIAGERVPFSWLDVQLVAARHRTLHLAGEDVPAFALGALGVKVTAHWLAHSHSVTPPRRAV